MEEFLKLQSKDPKEERTHFTQEGPVGAEKSLCSLPTPSAAPPIPTEVPKGVEVSSGPISLPSKFSLQPIGRTPVS